MTQSIILEKKGEIGDYINIDKYETVRTDAIIELLEKKKPCSGYILTANVDSERNYTEGKYSYDGDGDLKFSECSLKITIKENGKTRKKTFSQQEKLSLFLEYVKKYNKMPDPDVLYKECPIGKFMIDAERWTEICNAVNEVKDEKQ